MWGFKKEGLEVYLEKKENNEYNVVILFMRGVPAIPCAHPTRCVGCFNIHPGKKKEEKKFQPGFLSWDSLLQPSVLQRTTWLSAELSHDSVSGRKKSEKYTPKAQGWCSKPREGRGIFQLLSKYTTVPPSYFGMWASCDGQLAKELNTHISSEGCWQLEKQQCVCKCLSMQMFCCVRSLTEKYCRHYFPQFIVNSIWKPGTKALLCNLFLFKSQLLGAFSSPHQSERFPLLRRWCCLWLFVCVFLLCCMITLHCA